ncbi:hypothetical protein AMC82_PC00061 (plasmid) [Rhizobium phaseoli]|uniref:Uncharacterized protein n=1 Tax=Rhizobium phaseoli TaxID=396 RepID=A0ABN4QQW8_9HYPH|nr:hypothetical protein [Rhizobium phaseoli]ANL68625.1 hypothetical protein AMC84_PC00061 [Rhizobium phaseoli]ANL81434.1 hypothetical protein AMC82_PC00061 [Rhizobium phaseoli]ANL87921.1 hypothetical protein AMC81_PD00064 [Rhizobium phaseoli]ANL94430.1 hypothetical protein AMC80_PD00064 [Rhizobium phaseoli]RDJ03677.1 hypothetical protein B5K05_28325 [Rhizobium phaseoli]
MENETSIGQPIPTAVLTPTEIIAQADTAARTSQQTNPLATNGLDFPAPATNLFVEMMFAPIGFWAWVSASYFRLFDLQDPTDRQRYH